MAVFPDIPTFLLLFCWIGTIISAAGKRNMLTSFLSLALALGGVNVLINGLVGISNNFLLTAFGAVSLGFGFVVMIVNAISIIQENI